jgi:hypothetical protein
MITSTGHPLVEIELHGGAVKASDRTMATNLEAIMSRHDDYVKRTISDLRRAGFREDTIEAAYERLAAQRALPGLTQAQIDMAVYEIRNRRKKK